MISVLVVDDSITDLQIIANALNKDDGITAHYCNDSTKAIDTAIKIKPDIIILDVLMPQIDGISLRQQLLANTVTNSIPVIFISADDHAETQLAGYKVGCLSYLTKPIDRKQLVSLIKNNSIIRRLDSVMQSNRFMLDSLDKCAVCSLSNRHFNQAK